MKANDSGRTSSYWMQSPVPDFSDEIPRTSIADVVVVGAGITGLTTAYLLARANKVVIVVDDGPIGGGETARTTAHLSNALDEGYFHLEQLHGARGAALAADSHTAAIEWIERTAEAEDIECDFTRLPGYLFLAPGHEVGYLERELAAARRAGLADVQMVPRAPLPRFGTGPALLFPEQGQMHPLRYLSGLAQALIRRRGRIFTNAHAEIMEGGPRAKVVLRGGQTITADALVVATNTPVNNRVVIHTKQAAYRTYVIGVEIPRGTIAPALFWDTGDPYHYVRLAEPELYASEHDVLIVGGEDHKTGQTDDAKARWDRLETWTRQRFPEVRHVIHRWSGQIMEPADGLAYIGRNPRDDDNVFIATGDSGHGMTHGTIAGLLLTDLIIGRENPWATLYDPGRLSLRALPELARENLNVARQYTDWLGAGEVSDVDQIEPGHGAIVRRGLRRIAVYKDLAGDCHAMSAACPHLGGAVRWNSAEETWDCPCHGSRFDTHGRVLNGPAISDLEPETDGPAAESSGFVLSREQPLAGAD